MTAPLHAGAPPVTALYVPGDRPDRFDKAVGTGAEVVILDLEDAVAPAHKARARDAVVGWLTAHADEGRSAFQVRVNAGDRDDLAAVASLPWGVQLRLPKVEGPGDVDAAARACPGRGVVAIVETARGLREATATAQHRAVSGVVLGEADLLSDLGAASAALVDHARFALLVAARAAGLPAPMLSAYPRIRDLDGLRADTERGRALGWFGRTAVHPSQLAVIREVFAPTEDELAWADEVLSAVVGGGVATLGDGQMVDPAMIGRARAIRDRASSGPGSPPAGS